MHCENIPATISFAIGCALLFSPSHQQLLIPFLETPSTLLTLSPSAGAEVPAAAGPAQGARQVLAAADAAASGQPAQRLSAHSVRQRHEEVWPVSDSAREAGPAGRPAGRPVCRRDSALDEAGRPSQGRRTVAGGDGWLRGAEGEAGAFTRSMALDNGGSLVTCARVQSALMLRFYRR